MQPEDIIAAKEWPQLTMDERRLLAPLAATEGEYNVLKKLLLLALEEAEDVPAVSPSVQTALQARLPAFPSVVYRMRWMAAAAAVVLLAVAAFFLLQPKQPTGRADIRDLVPARKPANETAINRTGLHQPARQSNAGDSNGAQALVPKKQATAMAKPARVDKPALVQTELSVGVNEDLLAFATEAY